MCNLIRRMDGGSEDLRRRPRGNLIEKSGGCVVIHSILAKFLANVKVLLDFNFIP